MGSFLAVSRSLKAFGRQEESFFLIHDYKLVAQQATLLFVYLLLINLG